MPLMKSSAKLPWRRCLTVTALAAAVLAGCSGSNDVNGDTAASPAASASPNVSAATNAPAAGYTEVDEQPSSVYYEIFVRSFYDSDGDGIGDLKGITQKLDYLNDGDPSTNSDLGIEGIWLMPITASGSYHGYDVTDYRTINPDYGTNDDLKELVQEAHKRGIKVIMDLVINHTSTDHPWFLDSASSKDSKYRDYYVWAEDQNRSVSGVSAAGSQDPWHDLKGSHYMGTFWEGMPDLNYDNPDVRKEMKEIGKYWLQQGLDGFRVDGAKHIYEDLASDKNEATTAKNMEWWHEFRTEMTGVKPDIYMVGEVWENSASSVSPYLNGAFDSCFNFELADMLISAAHSEKDSGAVSRLEKIYNLYAKVSGGSFTDATFLSNHDQDRVMSQLAGNLDHAKMAASLLLTLPGNPYIYYGEEIGMLGKKPDEEIREPMRWVHEEQGSGQTNWEPVIHNLSSTGISVMEEDSDSRSLLNRYRQLIAMRRDIPALRDGGMREYATGNTGTMAFERITSSQKVLVIHNLTGVSQSLNLAETSDGTRYTSILGGTSDSASLTGDLLALPPYSSVILE